MAAPNLPSNKPGRWKKNPSLLSQKALAKLNSAGGCKEPYQPWAARTTAKSTLELIHSHMPPLLSVGSSERENVGKRGNGSETTLSPGLASSPVSTPCPSTADAAGPIQLESRPWAGERTTLLAPQKASPKNKMCSHSSPNPWLWHRNEASEMQEGIHTCSFPKHPLLSLHSTAALPATLLHCI